MWPRVSRTMVIRSQLRMRQRTRDCPLGLLKPCAISSHVGRYSRGYGADAPTCILSKKPVGPQKSLGLSNPRTRAHNLEPRPLYRISMAVWRSITPSRIPTLQETSSPSHLQCGVSHIRTQDPNHCWNHPDPKRSTQSFLAVAGDIPS